MKQYKCKMQTDTKTLSLNNQTLVIKNNEFYAESIFTKAFPSLFIEIHSSDIKGSSNISESLQTIETSNYDIKTTDYTTINTNINLKDKSNFVYNFILRQINHIKNSLAITPKDNIKTKFNWFRFILLGLAILVIAGISAYLRIHGIMGVFDVEIYVASVLVAGFIISEFAISSLMLREITSRLYYIINITILGTIQVILLIISFVFEFSMMSNYIEKQKVDGSINNKNIIIIENKLNNYNTQIDMMTKQINITPNSYISKRNKLTNKLNRIVELKNKESDKLRDILNNKNAIQSKKDGVGFENTAKILGVEESFITKGIIVFIAGILNVLYVSFMYGFVSEWKRRR